MKKKINIDIWQLIDVNNVNHILDEHLINKGINPVDIKYKCIKIEEDGTLLIEADFEVYEEET